MQWSECFFWTIRSCWRSYEEPTSPPFTLLHFPQACHSSRPQWITHLHNHQTIHLSMEAPCLLFPCGGPGPWPVLWPGWSETSGGGSLARNGQCSWLALDLVFSPCSWVGMSGWLEGLVGWMVENGFWMLESGTIGDLVRGR